MSLVMTKLERSSWQSEKTLPRSNQRLFDWALSRLNGCGHRRRMEDNVADETKTLGLGHVTVDSEWSLCSNRRHHHRRIEGTPTGPHLGQIKGPPTWPHHGQIGEVTMAEWKTSA